MGIDIVALQEPAINAFNCTIASKDWMTVYPTPHKVKPNKTRSVTLINSQLNTDTWTQLDFPSSDVTVIQLAGSWGKLTLFNIYNDGNSNETITELTNFYQRNRNVIGNEDETNAHIIWLGDFNRHHPHWDDPSDTRLFTTEAISNAEILMEALAEVGLDTALPSGIPTHQHNVTKKWSRLDHVFITEHSANLLTACSTLLEHRGINTDHLPIRTELNLKVSLDEVAPAPNYREVDWEEFGKALETRLAEMQPVERITTQRQLDRSCDSLTKVIQSVIHEQVPIAKISAKTKRWWTKELTQLRKLAGKLGRRAYKRRCDPTHPIHQEYKEVAKRYDKTLQYTKRQHWRDWLEKAEDPDIWTVQRVISAPAADGGKARIPILRQKVGDQEIVANTNSEKSDMLARGFFPPKPQNDGIQHGYKYPRQRGGQCKITREQVMKQLRKLKPYKAPGPDGIPNIILTKNAELLADRLVPIYEAMFERQLFYKPWKTFTTVVLRKPGKPNYEVAKAYRPIALLNTMWKVLTAIVADQLTHATEKYQLLPAKHFGGRPGRTTTDAMHLLAHEIKSSWRNGKVTSVLFLDIEGAFPNAVPARLIHNLRKRSVPGKIVDFIHGMLRGRQTALKFDGYVSNPIDIENGIGQGDPLSMVIYQYYNADLLDIPKEDGESASAYVDDTIMAATAPTFAETHDMLVDMMTREGGVADWSSEHNSPLEYSKLALIDFAHRSAKVEREPLRLPQGTVTPAANAKYLGVIFDQHLDWKAQHANALDKGTKWAMQIRRLTRPTWGITPLYARRLYESVAIPRALYAVDVWSGARAGSQRNRNISAKVIKQQITLQRAGALAITGGLRTSPTDVLDASAFLLPAQLTIDKWCHRALVRLAMLPAGHPLYKIIANRRTSKVKRHKSPLNILLANYGYDTRSFEKIPATTVNPAKRGKIPFEIDIAADREASTRDAEAAEEEIQVYSDGSAINGKVGAAALLFRTGKPTRVLHKHLGPESEHTVHEAELVGLLLGIHLISTEKQSNTKCMIGADNQAALKAFHSNLRSPGHHIAREILRVAEQIRKRRNGNKYKLAFRWTAGHEGIEGNEEADREAKRAAEGMSSERKALPAYLRKPLSINPAAVKRARHGTLKKEWAEGWRNSPRGRRIGRIAEETPSKKFLGTISQSELNREAASRIAQFRISHVPVNQYLKRVGKVDSARCPACGADEETIEHYLLLCPSYAYERWALGMQARKQGKQLTLKTVLGERSMAIPLANYIDATHRFKREGERGEGGGGGSGG